MTEQPHQSAVKTEQSVPSVVKTDNELYVCTQRVSTLHMHTHLQS